MPRLTKNPRTLRSLLLICLVGVIAGLPLYSLAAGRVVAVVPASEVQNAADGKCDGLEVEITDLISGEAIFELSPPLASAGFLDGGSIDLQSALARNHLQRGPPRR